MPAAHPAHTLHVDVALQVSDWAKVQKLLKDYLDDYNSSHTNTMDLVFFQAAVDHVCHLCRVLQQVRLL